MPIKVYISGPMTGMPELNFPAFHAAAERWRKGGAEVVSPAELNPDPNAEWGACMRTDIKALCDCDAIFMLRGWENSKGANCEKYIAEALKMDVYYQAEVAETHNGKQISRHGVESDTVQIRALETIEKLARS